MAATTAAARTKMVEDFTAAYDVYCKHYNSVSQTVREVLVKGLLVPSTLSTLQGRKYQSDSDKVMEAAMDFKHFCEFPNLFEHKEIMQCLTALECFTEFLNPPKTIAITDTAFTALYQRNAQFRKQWLLALRSIVDYVAPLHGGTVNRLASGSLNRRDASWLHAYDYKAILAKLAAAEATKSGQPSVPLPRRRFRAHSQLETAVLHSMRAVLHASSKF